MDLSRDVPAKVAEQLRTLDHVLGLMREHGLAELELELEDLRICARKAGAPAAQDRAAADAADPAPAGRGPVATVVEAPVVGTFYRAGAPDAAPFVEVGDRVEPGDVLCVIEAMKLMNDIKAEFAGEVVEVLAEDGQAVEYGQALLTLLPSAGRRAS